VIIMTDTVPETARLTADVALFGRREGNLYVAAILRGHDPYAGCWALPGGHVDVNEETLDAARRELTEETGVSVDMLELVGVYSTPGRDPRGRYVTFAYACLLEHTIPMTAGDDATEAQWVLVDDLLTDGVRLAFDHDRIIRDAHRAVHGGRPVIWS
jgi:8-oxo-dGTP diphosphatase